jgi:membrane-bound metal-dependent hydrolase YbcI (DUF457 family)
MPFTLAHPAAAVPLRRLLGGSGVLSALIIGSLTPDFAYFVPWTVNVLEARGGTHSLLGLFWFCLPVGLITYVAFHVLVKEPAVALLPEPMAQRLWPLVDREPGLPRVSFWAVALSLMAGALTHPLWDAFTHYGGPAMEMFPFLNTAVGQVFGQTVRVFNVLQHASTLGGLGLLAWWTMRWIRAAPAPELPRPRLAPRIRTVLLLIVVLLAAAGAIFGGWRAARVGQGWWAVETFVWHAAVWGMGAFGLSLLLLGIVWRGTEWRELAET